MQDALLHICAISVTHLVSFLPWQTETTHLLVKVHVFYVACEVVHGALKHF